MTGTSPFDPDALQSTQAPGTPIYQRLYRRYREAIAAGRLRPGERVPSVRALASELNLARGTVELVYQMLTTEGYLLARGPAGTFVAPGLGTLAEARRTPAPRRAGQAPVHTQHAGGEPWPFQLGLPALDAFPRKPWARLLGQHARSVGTAAMTMPDPAGHAALRRAIASYLGISRGIACTPEQVFVTVGYRGALDLLCRTVLRPGDTGWFEEPGYLFARQFLMHSGMRLAPVPVDAQGLNVAQGLRRAPDARLAVVTPTHQSPLGVALSLPRRLALLDWARRRKAWIVEDDYDSEFRYHGRPLPALKSLDGEGRVLYTGTFSKVLFPGLRLAYLVVPASHIERFQATAQQLPGAGPDLLQATVAAFMEQGHFARHLRRMRTLYAARRAHLVDALAEVFGPALQVQPQAGGLHVLAHLAEGRDDRALAAAAQANGLAVQALGDWYLRRATGRGLLMGFANMADAATARRLVRRLQTATQGL